MDEAYIKKSNDSTVTEIKDRLKANNEKPGSVNQVGGTADDTDMAKIIANESSEDFQKRVNAVKAKAGA
jgi:capsular polysaccharide biosynthesis protein